MVVTNSRGRSAEERVMGRGDWADSRRSEGLVGWGIVDQLGESVMNWCGGCACW